MIKLSTKVSFVIAMIVLGSSAVALEGATRFLKLHFRKERVELRQALEQISSPFGPWVQVSEDTPLPEDIEHTLGTSNYIFRDYLDSRVFNQETIDSFKGKSAIERKQQFLELQQKTPEGAISLSLTYYTGLVDTVAHVPDRCYIADGYDVASADNLKWPAGGRNLAVRYLSFEDTTGVQRVSRNVAYLFQANGKYVAGPIDVRIVLQDLFARYGYYAKIELMTTMSDRDKSAKIMDDFLGHAMAPIEMALPDWKQYQNKK